MDVKLSVIIPVYNAEKYLHQCLDSVLSQSLRELELICVNDCSTDSGPEILEKYAAEDSRVKVIHNKENRHAGPCRNIGLEAACGEYVLFMDSDDFLAVGSLEKVYKTASGKAVDVLRCKAHDLDDKRGEISQSVFNALKNVPKSMFERVMEYEDAPELFSKVNVAPWGGIFRRDFLTENSIKYNDLKCVNDRSFFSETVLKAKRIVFSDTYLINYRINNSSSLIGNRAKNFDCHFRSYEIVSRNSESLSPELRRCCLDGELIDMAFWLEKSSKTEYFPAIKEKTEAFLCSMDKSPWGGKVEKTIWYRQMNSVLTGKIYIKDALRAQLKKLLGRG